MIRAVEAGEAEHVFDLMGNVYANHSFLQQGVDTYADQLATGEYVSLGDFDEDGTLQAHAGYRTHPDFALINALVVNPTRRGTGLGRSIFEARLDHIKESGSFDFIVGYSMMQHLRSQKLYADGFKPIGLDIGYEDIYHQTDGQYNQGAASNAELVLCQRISSRDYSVDITFPRGDWPLAQKVLESVGVVGRFSDEPEDPADAEFFLGFHPTIEQGLFVPAHLGKAALVEFAPLLTSNEERRIFVNTVKEGYERDTSS